MPRILIRFVHGLGDALQLSVVLKHLKRYRPDWEVDVLAGRGKHSALEGLCHASYHDQGQFPTGPYDQLLGITFAENYNNFHDGRPGSKVTNCLRDEFGLDEWDADLGRYYCHRPAEAGGRAEEYLRSVGCAKNEGGKYNAVVLHYAGNTSEQKKNLAHWQAEALVDLARKLGRVPVVLDWDDRCPLADQKRAFCPRPGEGDIWGNFGSGDAATIACLVHAAEAFVGIDSGPAHVAAATDTPSLVCWIGHHPMQFFDPAPNCLHLVPAAHRQMPPLCNEPRMVPVFEKLYRFTTYEGEHGLAESACRWLAETLGARDMPAEELRPTSYLLPPGIGDATWALLKIQSVAGKGPIDVTLSGDPGKEVDRRAVPFVKRFRFIRDVKVSDVPILEDTREHKTDALGRYRYLPDGPRGAYHFLMPNKVLEEGRRIEEWLPDHRVNWDIFDQFDWSCTDRGVLLGKLLHPFVAFYLGPEAAHTDEGHNRGWLWEPRHWVELGRAVKEEHGCNIAVVGADYDRSFFERYVREGLEKEGLVWHDLIGKLEIGETLAFLKASRALVSFQCGLGIVLHYLGGRVVMWWREEGNSAHPKRLVSFAEAMKDAWIRPGWERNYFGAVYRRESVNDLLQVMEERGWLKT